MGKRKRIANANRRLAQQAGAREQPETAEVTIADVIFEAMPFSRELGEWCRRFPDFKYGLKFTNSDVFLPVGATLTSHPINHPQHEVIGFLVYDMQHKHFKQDYILNLNSANEEFILYSKVPGSLDGPRVKHIKDFFARYDPDGRYKKGHHMTIEKVDEYAQSMRMPFMSHMAHFVVERGETGIVPPTQEQLRHTLEAIHAHKAKSRGFISSKNRTKIPY